jgi:hypothetical protein
LQQYLSVDEHAGLERLNGEDVVVLGNSRAEFVRVVVNCDSVVLPLDRIHHASHGLADNELSSLRFLV